MIPRRPDLDDLDWEMRDHIDAETQDNVARGMSEDEARTAAMRTFGNVARMKEDVRAVWTPGWLDQLQQDTRDAVRYVRRTPSFSVAIGQWRRGAGRSPSASVSRRTHSWPMPPSLVCGAGAVCGIAAGWGGLACTGGSTDCDGGALRWRCGVAPLGSGLASTGGWPACDGSALRWPKFGF